MIATIRHKGLRNFYENGSLKGIQANHAKRLRMMLAALDSSLEIGDMDIPGYRLHQLKGNMKNRWSVSVSGNWRLTFEFRESKVHLFDDEDYH